MSGSLIDGTQEKSRAQSLFSKGLNSPVLDPTLRIILGRRAEKLVVPVAITRLLDRSASAWSKIVKSPSNEQRVLASAIDAGMSGRELAAFMATIKAETGFALARELSYTNAAQAKANLYCLRAYSQEEVARAIAGGQKVFFDMAYGYGNRSGKGKELGNRPGTDDGWKYRGGGFIQLTGRNNYAAFSAATGIDAVSNPDVLMNFSDAMAAAVWYWKERVRPGDERDIVEVTKRVTGSASPKSMPLRVAAYQRYLGAVAQA